MSLFEGRPGRADYQWFIRGLNPLLCNSSGNAVDARRASIGVRTRRVAIDRLHRMLWAREATRVKYIRLALIGNDVAVLQKIDLDIVYGRPGGAVPVPWGEATSNSQMPRSAQHGKDRVDLATSVRGPTGSSLPDPRRYIPPPVTVPVVDVRIQSTRALQVQDQRCEGAMAALSRATPAKSRTHRAIADITHEGSPNRALNATTISKLVMMATKTPGVAARVVERWRRCR